MKNRKKQNKLKCKKPQKKQMIDIKNKIKLKIKNKK